jgi:hypothetical protein
LELGRVQSRGRWARPNSNFRFVLISLFATEKGFVHFNDAAKFIERPIGSAASLAEPSQDEPCGFLRYPDLFPELQAGDALAGGNEQVHAVQPFVERHLRPFEDGVGSDREIEGATQAAVVTSLARGARSQDAHALARLAIGAGWSIGPKAIFQIDSRRFFVGEQSEQLEGADCGFRHLGTTVFGAREAASGIYLRARTRNPSSLV